MSGQDEGTHRFVLVGKLLRGAFRQLRVAFPKKRDIPFVAATFRVAPNIVEIGLPGAAVKIPCESTDHFTAQIPFDHFKQLEGDPYADTDLIRFAFGDGRMTVGGVTVHSPSILLSVERQVAAPIEKPILPERTKAMTPQAATAAVPQGPEPMDSAIGFPLVGAYRQMRRYPDPTMVINTSPSARNARVKVEDILDKADKLLKPLGLCRRDIEQLLDQRLGLSE